LNQTDIEKAIQEKTIKERKDSIMLGAPEVLQYGKHLIQLIKGKRCLDIGTYTGASAVAWALAIPEDGEVFTFDVDHKAIDDIGRPFIKQNPNLEKKITFKLGKAIEKLDDLIVQGEQGKWDFAFIDADKENYINYYDRAMKLLRSGGIVLVDNVCSVFLKITIF
jgi:predicted O-methyltransferase YrrM